MTKKEWAKIIDFVAEDLEAPPGFRYEGQNIYERVEGWFEVAMEKLDNEIKDFKDNPEEEEEEEDDEEE